MIANSRLIAECLACYSYPMFRAGPDGRDGATIRAIAGETLIVFRGTLCWGEAGLLDWLNDFLSGLVPRPEYPGRVHEGFANSLEDLWQFLDRYTWGKGLWITGHSKGGALAILAGYRLRDYRPNVVTFAAPKVANDTFTAAYGVACTQYVNPHDLVPHFPPVGYDRVGTVMGPPDHWIAPRDVLKNHHLQTGYAPWILDDTPPAAAQRRAA